MTLTTDLQRLLLGSAAHRAVQTPTFFPHPVFRATIAAEGRVISSPDTGDREWESYYELPNGRFACCRWNDSAQRWKLCYGPNTKVYGLNNDPLKFANWLQDEVSIPTWIIHEPL